MPCPREFRRVAGALALVVLVALAGCSRAPKPAPVPAPSARPGAVSTGLASYYAAKFEGRRTASGEVYSRDRLTAAHRTLPFGTRVRVTRVATGKSVELVINDRGPFREGRIVDVSGRAAEILGLLTVGVAEVRLEVLSLAVP